MTLVNDHEVYALSRETLVEQHGAHDIDWIAISADQYKLNAAQALNLGIEQARTDWVVCAHQDVLFPNGWWPRAMEQIALWPGRVGVAGLAGMKCSGRLRGHVLDPHGLIRWPGPLPDLVTSIDEHLIILRKELPVRFDPLNPGFHCYGTDIALEARKSNYDAIVIDAPVVHLSGGMLDSDYGEAAQWLLQKWGRDLGFVIPTPGAGVIRRPFPHALIRRLVVSCNARLSRFHRRSSLDQFRDPNAGELSMTRGLGV